MPLNRRFRATKPEDLDHVTASPDERRRVARVMILNLVLFQWFFFRVSVEYSQWDYETPVSFVGYRCSFAIPGTGWL